MSPTFRLDDEDRAQDGRNTKFVSLHNSLHGFVRFGFSSSRAACV